MENTSKRLFDASPVDDTVVEQVLKQHWPGAVLGSRIKSSQNVTFTGELPGAKKVIVRATSTPDCLSRIQDELAFLRYVADKNVSACGPVGVGVAASND